MSVLNDILASTRRRIDDKKSSLDNGDLERSIADRGPVRSLRGALTTEAFGIIAEIKRRTPRAGDLDLDLDPSALATAYAGGGAAAISVLAEPEFFAGSIDDVVAACDAGVPVLLKDFVLDEIQLLEARSAGADAALVIVRIVDPPVLARLMTAARSIGLEVLVEVFDDADLERALEAGAEIVGVNHRDLATFEVDPDRTAKLAPHVPSDVVLVGLSGVDARADIVALQEAGARAALVGEALVTATDPAAKIGELLGR